ncbi:hypothetical protein ACFV0T_26640 [Streptomyces sp. NPDC059582]|uniref:hypothetical protein n=1 Tax=Streptomyces sp. NPDC059582 TaxID=3346875 RepID=UPI0036B3859B
MDVVRHQWVAVWEHGMRCSVCGVTAERQRDRRYGLGWWTQYMTASGWSWHAPDGSGSAPPCPPPPVEALCPEDWRAQRYAGAKGDDQLDTAMSTWCAVHEQAVSECVDPGPACPGAPAHSDKGPGPCTGHEDSCDCMCPACCGDTPDMYGYDGD